MIEHTRVTRAALAMGALLALGVAAGGPAHAASAKLEWRQTDVPIGDVKVANYKMKTIIEQGWTPWGLANRAGTLQAFFIRGPNMFPYDAWKIDFVKTGRATLEATMQGLLEQDWLPVGMSGAGPGVLAVVLLHVPNLAQTLHSWRLSPCTLDATWGKCMNEGVTARMNEQYLPMAMTMFDSQLWVFYVRSAKVEKLPFKGWKAPKSLSTTTEIAKNINGAIPQGMVPMAFMIVGSDFLPLYVHP